MKLNSKIYLAGHRGFVGPAILKTLEKYGYNNIVYKTSKELDLRDQNDVNSFFEQESPDIVILNAAKASSISGGKSSPASQLYDNSQIASNVIHASYLTNVKKLLYISSATIYPSSCTSKIKESDLLAGKLDEIHEAHALAKLFGVKLCEAYRKQYNCDFISCVPCNIYGDNDVMEGDNVHVISGMINRFHEAKVNGLGAVTIWGSGNPRRDFLYVDDLADACVFLLNNYSAGSHINISSGESTSINELASIVKDIVEFNGEIVRDLSKPDGSAFRVLDSERINKLGWRPITSLEAGIKKMYNWYCGTLK